MNQAIDSGDESLRALLHRAIRLAEAADARSAAAEAVAQGAMASIREHIIRCENTTAMLHRDIRDTRGDIASIRFLIIRVVKYGGTSLSLLAAVQILGLERAFNLFQFIRN